MRWFGIGIALTICTACDHPWFQSGKTAPVDQRPGLATPGSPDTEGTANEYLPGTPAWVPLIDECIRTGRSRADCIDELPPEELAALKRWEQEIGQRRQERMLQNRERFPMFGVHE